VLSSTELCRLDRNYYASWPDVRISPFIGLDTSVYAIDYATRVGLIEQGVAANLEEGRLTAGAAKALENVG
jgi:hypothetical protein